MKGAFMFEPVFTYLEKFHTIPAADREVISRHIHTRHVQEGELLLQEGKLAREMFFVCQGILKIVSVNGKGNEVTQFFVKEDHFCTILNSFNNQVPAHESIKAACDTDLIVFSREQLWLLYTKLPYFQSLINHITQQTLLAKIQVRNSYMGEDAATRYQQFLQQQPDIALRVPLSDVASYLGITQQSLSRIRKQHK
ncbi:MAG TPA: Crp/Fnr family transcriptional regulator [Chitinophaga sp.]|uniref:Crp/Fnr family transcriptional regulator n=1 Tax=Chitinophaga sp. TaxID=1869181 RepID=UPI002F936DF8